MSQSYASLTSRTHSVAEIQHVRTLPKPCCMLRVARSRGVGSTSQVVSRRSRGTLNVVAFKFLKDLGLKKPDFLPDFGKEKRLAVLNKFFTSFDQQVWDELLDDSFEMVEASHDGQPPKRFSKQDYEDLVLKRVIPAIPDFKWGHATDASKDDAGYSIVTVTATGHHTGKPFALPGLPAVEATGRRFAMDEEKIRVKVEDGKIKEMMVLPVKNAGPIALYKALGGQVPS